MSMLQIVSFFPCGDHGSNGTTLQLEQRTRQSVQVQLGTVTVTAVLVPYVIPTSKPEVC